MWSVSLLEDPLELGHEDPLTGHALIGTRVALARCSLENLFQPNTQVWQAFTEGGRVARVALADYVARVLEHSYYQDHHEEKDAFENNWCLRLEPLSRTTLHQSHHFSRRRRHKRSSRSSSNDQNPFLLERTDVVACQPDGMLHVFLRIFVYTKTSTAATAETKNGNTTSTLPINLDDETLVEAMKQDVVAVLRKLLLDVDSSNSRRTTSSNNMLMLHVATAVLQDKLRAVLPSRDAVAFVANGAILPRKSGASAAPMASPPAIPFRAPADSPMNQSVTVDLGLLYPYIVESLPSSSSGTKSGGTEITLEGLLVPRGVSLIVGGGYHGKSTLLRCLAAGVYNKIPGDGREFCVTVDDAVTVRAEDGRYVNHCNVSAFISNLPTPSLDTSRFSSGEASGSTSQATNVSESIEMGASALLVDEDTSAANFMARDGRMRSLVMDESITPLLYRVNGLFASHGISSIVVVGGVGDWLDVINSAILMDRYICKDATAKARSVSKQFSHGHVQYGGRGVVHRLEWEKSGTPIPRRPAVDEKEAYNFALDKIAVTLLDGSNTISLQQISDEDENNVDAMSLESDDDDDGDYEEPYMDMSRCEQLMGKKPQLYGCGLCVAYLLSAARRYPELGLPDLLRKMDETLDAKGLLGMILKTGKFPQSVDDPSLSATWKLLVESLGCAYRPRRFEVGQALTRLRGIIMEAIPVEDDGTEAAVKAEAERKKQELLAIWNARRKNPLEQMSQQAASTDGS